MSKYEIYEHAGKVPYAQWKERGIAVPIFDKDGTLSHANQLDFVDEVVDELAEAQLPDIFPHIAIASNNNHYEHVDSFAKSLHKRLGVGVYAITKNTRTIDFPDGVKKKSAPDMGIAIVDYYGISPEEAGVVGDRWMTDVIFGHRLGAGAVALCAKAGEGDAMFVPALRVVERVLVRADILTKRAARG